MVEEAHVEPIIEITKMMYALRAYQSAQRIVDAEDRAQSQTINTLTQTN